MSIIPMTGRELSTNSNTICNVHQKEGRRGRAGEENVEERERKRKNGKGKY